MLKRRGLVRKTFILLVALLLSISGVLPNLVGLSKAFAFGTNGPNEYLIIKESTTWDGEQTIDKPVIIAPNVTLTISENAQITFNQDLIVYGKLANNGTISDFTNLYSNIYGGFSGDLNYPNNGVIENKGHINGGNIYFNPDKYPEPPFISNYGQGSGTSFVTGETVPGFIVNIGGHEQTAALDGNYNIQIGEITGSQTLDVIVTDIFGRVINLAPIQIEDPGSVDMAAPTWSSDSAISSSNLTENGVTLNWNPASDESGISDYYIHQNGNRIGLVSGNVTSYEVSGLTPETSYQFKIEASDTSGNVSTTGPSIDIATPTTPTDTQAPAWPIEAKLVASNIGDSSLILNWSTAIDDSGVTNYKLYKNGSLLSTFDSSVQSYTVMGLTPSTSYTFKIEAGDTSGNWTSNGPSLDVATAAMVPTAKVTFPDSRVEEAVREALGKPSGDITKEDMLGITSLYLSNVSNLAGLQYAQNLDSLTITDSTSVSDYSSISTLTNLTNLVINWSGVENLSFLSNLTKLTNLNLYYNRITNIAGIEALTNLSSLNLYHNQIEDITPLMTNMENGGIGAGNYVDLRNNYLELTETSKSWGDIQTLKENGVGIDYSQQYGTITIKATDLYNPDKQINGIYAYLNGSYNSYYSEVDENGDYAIKGVPAGTYTLQVSTSEGYENVTRTIRVQSGSRINLNIGLTPYQQDPSITNGVVTGIVTDENGVPIQGAKVFVQNGTDSAYTDYSGHYILRLPAGDYNVITEAVGYESQLAENLLVIAGQKLTQDFPLISTAENPKVTFPDSRVEEAVREVLGKPSGDVTKEDMLGITSLYLSSVSNLAGLQYAQNLDSLTITDSTSVSDYSSISTLTNLTNLVINWSGVENLSFLSNLTKLTNLNLYYNRITNIAGIEALTNLSSLNLYHNQIEDITPLMTNMENGGIGSGNYVDLRNNYLELTETSKSWGDIQTLKENGVGIDYSQQYGTITIKATDLYNPDKQINGIYAYLNGSYNSYYSEVDENGNYTIKGVPAGTYTLQVSTSEGYENVTRTIRVQSGSRINLNIGLTPYQQDTLVTNGVITGVVEDENGVPIQGVKVFVQNGTDSAYTDYSGHYILRLPAGDYNVITEAVGYESQLIENVLIIAGHKLTQDFPLISTADNPKVTFPDSRVEEAIREALGKPSGDISKEDMLGITSLYLSSVSNLAGLQYANNLDSLTITDSTSVSDYSSISNLTNLTNLVINWSGVENLSFLSNLTKLTNLNLYYNRITNIAGIEALTNLSSLNLYHNKIEDITPLMTNMENGGIGSGNYVDIRNNYLELTETSKSWGDIRTLQENGVGVDYSQQYGMITIKATDLYNLDKEINGIYAYLNGSYNSYYSEVDENGDYTIKGVPAGTYTLQVSTSEGYENVTRTIRVQSGNRINLNIGLTPYQQDPSVTNGVITGIVQDENGVPVQGVKIYAHNGAEPVYTDFTGYYALPLEEGSYTIMYESPMYLSIKKENVTVTKANKTVVDVQLALTSDSTTPEWPADSKLSVSNLGETQVTLSWPAANDNVKVENYKIYQNGILQKIVTGSVTSVEMTGLTTGTDYTFKVEAGDAAGNWTTNGPETSIRTHAQADLAINFESDKIYVTEHSSLTLKASHANNLYGFDVEIKYDPTLIEVTDIKLNENFGVNGTTANLFKTNQDGVIRLVGTRLGDTEGISGEAELVDISYKALDKEGSAAFTILKGSSVSDTADALYVSNQDVHDELAIAIPVEGVVVDHTSLTLDTSTQKEGALVATVFPDSATNKEVTWSTSDPNIVEVDQTGKLTAISAGTATVTVVTNDKQYKAETLVTVLSSVTGVELDKSLLILDAATMESTVLNAKVLPENATNKKVIWTSSNPSVATVDESGKVQAVALGNAEITATTEEGSFTAKAKVKVTGIANFKVETSKEIIEKGESVSVSLKISDAKQLNKFLLGFNYNQDLFELVNIALDPQFGYAGTSAELSYTDNKGQMEITGKLVNSTDFKDGALGLVKLTLKAKTKTESSNFTVFSKSEYVDTKNITYLQPNNVEKRIAITYGDVTGDNAIAINDLGKVAKAFDKRAGQAGYYDYLDMNKDGLIDIIDIAYVANKVINKPVSTFALRSFAMYSVQNVAAYNIVNTPSIKLAIDQDINELMEGEVVNVKIKAENPTGLFGTQFTFHYDPEKMQLVDNQVHFNGDFSSFGGCSVDAVNGIVKCPVINSGSTTFTNDLVDIGYIPVKITKLGNTTLSLSEIKVVDNQIKEINENTTDTMELTLLNGAPNVDEISDKTTVITGTTEAGETVNVTIGTTSYIGTTYSNGVFKVTIPQQAAGTQITLTSTDQAGNVSPARTVTVSDKTAPSVPRVNYVTDRATVVTGTTEANATVIVTIGTETYTGSADIDGTFSVSIPVQTAGTRISVRANDAAGNSSYDKTISVLDRTRPSVPKVNYVSDKATVVTGETEGGAYITVTIGTETYTTRAYSNGTFKVSIPLQKVGTRISVRAQDAAGNNSSLRTVTVIDKTAPSVPKVNYVTDKATYVTGQTEGGAYITVTIGTETYTTRAYSNGTYKVSIPVQKAGTRVSVRAKDAAGNLSSLRTVTVLDKTAPSAPSVDPVTEKSTAITGKSEGGATILVTIGTETYTARAYSNGTYKVSIPLQNAGTKVSVRAKDSAGNLSGLKTITVIK